MNRVSETNNGIFKDMFKNMKNMFNNMPSDSTFASMSVSYKNGKVRKIVKHSENITQEEAEKILGNVDNMQKEVEEMNKEMKNFFKDME